MFTFIRTKKSVGHGVSLLALVIGSPAVAQSVDKAGSVRPADPGQAASEPSSQPGSLLANAGTPRSGKSDPASANDDIVVTGSRAVTNGAASPTPVTVVSSAQLKVSAPGNIADGVNTLPVFRGSTRPSTAGSGSPTTGSGANSLALRGLSPARTLLLLDGRRVAPTFLTGVTDANILPQGLVKRVDVVTGGASAAYGSDAVAGVVNFVLDTRYEGLKAELQGGLSSRGDAGSMKANLTVGKAFLEDKLHVVISADYWHQDGIDLDYNGRKWAEGGYGIIGAGTTSAQIVAPDVRDSLATFGGLITGCQPVGAACPINRMQFLPGGQLGSYRQGLYPNATTMSGGDGSKRRTNLMPETGFQNIFGHATFDVNDSFSVYAEGLYSHAHVKYFGTFSSNTTTASATIFNDNAFLPGTVRSQMLTNGINSFTYARVNADMGNIVYDNNTDVYRAVAGFEGTVGSNWKYSGYAQYGSSTFHAITTNNQITENYYNAADAVINPANGQTVCRSTLLGLPQGAGCVPVNLFGSGSPSAAAIDYIDDDSLLIIRTRQTVLAADMRGTLFDLPGGPLGIAFGAEYRHERGEQEVDFNGTKVRSGTGIRGFPASQNGQVGNYFLTPPQPLTGTLTVKEGYLEVNAPILKDVPLFSMLTLNGAVRYADYSSVGGVVTWKGGVIWEPIPDIRLRATRSRDIRAPNIAERFSPAIPNIGQGVNDPQQGGARFAVNTVQVGNRGLRQETGNTLVFGAVLKPRFLPGLTVSVDHFDIKISDVISLPTQQQVVDACGLSTCPLVARGADGIISLVTLPYQNLAKLNTNGEDFELEYTTRLHGLGLPGALSVRALATHTKELSLTLGTTTVNRVGDLNLAANQTVPAAVEWAGTFSASYSGDRFDFSVQERFVGSGRLDHTLNFASGFDTRVPSIWYTDLSASYRLPTRSGRFQLFAVVNNLFDKDPPITPGGAVTTPRAANASLYDFVGRFVTAGVRVAF